IVRLYFTVFAAATIPIDFPGLSGDSVLDFLGPVLFVMAAASIVLGGVAAVGRADLDELLAHSSISQVGFIALPLAVAATVDDPSIRALGVTAALVYAFNHGLAKGLLFLASATVQDAVGTSRLRDLGGLAGRAPVLAGAFLVGALALIGIPPFSGFFGKLLVFQTAATAVATNAVGGWAALAIALLGAVLTVAYYTRAWNLVFWGTPSDAVRMRLPSRWSGVRPDTDAAVADGGDVVGGDDAVRNLSLTGEVVIVVALAVTIFAFGIGFDALFVAAQTAAQAALDTGAYVDAVDPAEVLG
ncbi:MAG: proton-conducting transporter membrane subunit, partial [Halobacteriota archaeon]